MHEFSDLADAFRVTAFIDVLGWSSLTKGFPLVISRRIRRGEVLTSEERAHAEQLRRAMQLARKLNCEIKSILAELGALCTPNERVAGNSAARKFWRHRHVTYVRASDSIFAHSSSMQVMSVFVSELLKRGLNRGILFRAGLAAGIAEHTEEPPHEASDVRTRDITIIGDGFTSAVAAERKKGTGVHAWLCPRLVELLDQKEHTVGKWRTESAELFWWTNFRAVWPTSAAVEHCNPISSSWCDDTIDRLQRSTEFGWNRCEPDGLARVEDTIQLLHSVRVSFAS